MSLKLSDKPSKNVSIYLRKTYWVFRVIIRKWVTYTSEYRCVFGGTLTKTVEMSISGFRPSLVLQEVMCLPICLTLCRYADL